VRHVRDGSTWEYLVDAPSLRTVYAGVEDGCCFITCSDLFAEGVNVFALAFRTVYMNGVLD
jgi:hypothetical protein